LSGITSAVTRGLPSFRIFGNVSDPQPNPTHLKAKNFDPTQPSPTQPNPWVDPTHGQLWAIRSRGLQRKPT